MIILDAHQDIAMNAVTGQRDYRLSPLLHRRAEGKHAKTAAMIGLPDSILGRVAVIFATLFALPQSSRNAATGYTDARGAYQQALQQMDYYQRLSDEEDRVRLIRRLADLDAVLASWADGTDLSDHLQGLVILMEGADPILEPKQFEEWYERGVRLVGPAWRGTRYAGGTGAPGGFTDLGKDLLAILGDFNVMLDLSHLAEEAVFEALERYEGVVVATHTNPRKFRDSDRHFSDEMIRKTAERDGVMGVVLFNTFLSNEWAAGDPRLPLSIVVDAIDHICQVTGSAAHVGIGSDFDGGFGAESTPLGLDTAGDLLEIARAMRVRGYDEAAINAIMSGNFLRKLRECLPE